jgi:hypothetical protein
VEAVARGEDTEKELDALIRRRHDRRVESEDERLEEELWRASERRHAERRREEMRWAWRAYHEGQAARHRAVLESLVGYHETQATKYRENGHPQREEDSSC